jgi:hypothetical protein
MSGAFASAALNLHANGLAVIPTGKGDGKSPLVKGWSAWKGQRRETVEQFARKHPDANIGVLTGLSRLTVVDCDDEKTLADAESRFGKSPLVTRSPRGGGHLYFKSNGERNANLRPELNIDVRGVGGLVLAPPSVRDGVGAYRLERGSWNDIAHLPQVAPGSLGRSNRRREVSALESRANRSIEGGRNNTLFAALRYQAGDCDSLESLMLEAHAINSQFNPPLPFAEAEKVARSVWKLKVEGRIIKKGQQRIQLSLDELESLTADGLYFLSWLKRWHGAKDGAPFALAPKSMAKTQVLPGWGRRRIEIAMIELRARGYLVRTHKGGSKSGDPSLYRLIHMGSPSSPNITNTPPAASSPGRSFKSFKEAA